jgi:hypothetical protein
MTDKYVPLPETWGEFTLMGNREQQYYERRWRQQVSALRGDIQASDCASSVVNQIGVNAIFTDEDIDLIEAAIDGCTQEAVAMFIYILLVERNRKR